MGAPFTYVANPSRVVFGPGRLAELGAELDRLGVRRALLLSTPEQAEPGSAAPAWARSAWPSRVDGTPLAGAVVASWHTDGDGFYDVQGPAGLEGLAGRARFRTDERGRFWFRSIVPASYPIPDDGPVGDMLKAQGRHPYRPAHVHFMVGAPGCETLVTHVFLAGDQYLDSDVVFGVKDSLVRALERQGPGITARGNRIDHEMAALRYDFVLADHAEQHRAAA